MNLGDKTNRREWMRMRIWFCVVLGNATTEQPKKKILMKQYYSGEKTVLDIADYHSGLLFLKKDNFKTEHTMDLASNTCD